MLTFVLWRYKSLIWQCLKNAKSKICAFTFFVLRKTSWSCGSFLVPGQLMSWARGWGGELSYVHAQHGQCSYAVVKGQSLK